MKPGLYMGAGVGILKLADNVAIREEWPGGRSVSGNYYSTLDDEGELAFNFLLATMDEVYLYAIDDSGRIAHGPALVDGYVQPAIGSGMIRLQGQIRSSGKWHLP